MEIFARFNDHEQVVFGHDSDSGLRCIVAIHNTALGPGLGGTRMRPYPSDDAALTDVLRLSAAMTLKNAMAGLSLGGGKAVIIGDPDTDKTPALLAAYGRIIASLNGRYVTACDVGTYPADMAIVHQITPWATGRPVDDGGSGDSGELTAYGVEVGMKAAATHRWGSGDLSGRHIAVQGLGKVGGRLARSLLGQGATVTVADIDADAVAELVAAGARSVAADELFGVDADILSPNALGGVLDDASIAGLTVEIVCGGANNQLAESRHATALAERGILYAPDYVVNSGGVINVSGELDPDGWSADRCRAKADGIGDTLAEVFAHAAATGSSTDAAARDIAARRIGAVPADQRFYLP